MSIERYIKVRTEFEGYHYYPDASKHHSDERISFLEHPHRHIFKVEATISVDHPDRALEFFLVKWALQDYIKGGDFDYKSCEMIAEEIINEHLAPKYGNDRYYRVVVSEDGENDGIVVFDPNKLSKTRY